MLRSLRRRLISDPLYAWAQRNLPPLSAAEREALEAAEELEINQLALVYLNRLSDLLFILARAANAGGDEPLWRPGSS